jgi:hypothetical protein
MNLVKRKIPRFEGTKNGVFVGIPQKYTGIVACGITYEDFYVKGKIYRCAGNRIVFQAYGATIHFRERFWSEIYKYYRSIGDEKCCQEAMMELLGAP